MPVSVTVTQGAEEADGIDSLIRIVRDQIGKGADWIVCRGPVNGDTLPDIAVANEDNNTVSVLLNTCLP
jgi:hypothetical protein